ncbi:MAG: efflux RND transporter periplasmic adaptor subunit [Deltaproteobacteria bacterium]|nr:efflux RND transporter periplasmic adaptor subunit [Deltaproteobacteria bacterium]
MKNIVFALIALMMVVACTKKAEDGSSPSAHIPVRRSTLEGKLSWKGIVRSASRMELRAERKIKIARVLVKNFQPVRKGQLLIEVDRSEQENKKRELTDKLNALQLELQAANTKYSHNARSASRKQGLFEKGIISQKEYDEAQKEYQLSSNELKSKELELEKARRELQETEDQLKTSDYRAPMDGTISTLAALEGQGASEINAGQLLGIISDPNHLALWIKIEENHIHRLSIGTPAWIQIDALSAEVIQGRVLELAINSAEPQGRLKYYDAVIGFDAGKRIIKEGFGGTATVVYAKKDNALTIPVVALKYLDGKEFVVASADEKSAGTPRQIHVGLRTDEEAEITSGLTENEYVIIDVSN